jgi:hypothetical protein
MSEWITDRRPTLKDGLMVYGPHGKVCDLSCIHTGEAWKPIPKCDAYVKPKRYVVRWKYYSEEGKGCWVVFSTGEYGGQEFLNLKHLTQYNDKHRKAAERIAAIYEEVMP